MVVENCKLLQKLLGRKGRSLDESELGLLLELMDGESSGLFWVPRLKFIFISDVEARREDGKKERREREGERQ